MTRSSEAIGAYRAALQVHLGEKRKLESATLNCKIGDMLCVLAGTLGGAERVATLRAALDAYAAAKKIYTDRRMNDLRSATRRTLKDTELELDALQCHAS